MWSLEVDIPPRTGHPTSLMIGSCCGPRYRPPHKPDARLSWRSSLPVMHLAFAIDDILAEILKCLALTPQYPTFDFTLAARPGHRFPTNQVRDTLILESSEQTARRQALRALALTCRALSEPALDALWFCPRQGLYTVFRLFSAFQPMQQKSRHSGQGEYERCVRQHVLVFVDCVLNPIAQHFLLGEISPQEWTTFCSYAARVRQLVFWDHGVPELACRIPSVVDSLNKYSQGQPLFPSLSVLAWQRSSEKSGDASMKLLLRMLAAPSLTTFVLWHPEAREDGTSITENVSMLLRSGARRDLETILRACPSLRHVTVQVDLEPLAIHNLAMCGELETITLVNHVDSRVLRRLSQLPFLRGLTLASSTDTFTSSRSTKLEPAFPVLQRITFRDTTLPAAARALASVSSPTLSSISVTVNLEDDLPIDFNPLLRVISAPRIAAALRTLELRMRYTFASFSVNPVFALVDITDALTQLPNIEALTVHAYQKVLSVSDSDLAHLACSLPRLSALTLTSETLLRPHLSGARPTIMGLVDLARRCTMLERIVCDVAHVGESDLSALEERATMENSDVARSSSLAIVVFVCNNAGRKTVLYDAGRLARAMRALFPRLLGWSAMTGNPRPLAAESASLAFLVALDELQGKS